MNLSKPWKKRFLIRQKGDAEAIHHLEQEELRDNQEQDPTSEAPVSQYIYYILRFSNIQQAVAFSKTVSFPVDTSELYKIGI